MVWVPSKKPYHKYGRQGCLSNNIGGFAEVRNLLVEVAIFYRDQNKSARKVEKYYKLAPEEDYILEKTLVVSYPTTEEIKSVIKNAGF
jgi:hypothetical protein